MAEERKAEDFPLERPSMGDNPPEEGTTGYEMAKASYDRAMVEYEKNLEKWLAGESLSTPDDGSEEDSE